MEALSGGLIRAKVSKHGPKPAQTWQIIVLGITWSVPAFLIAV